MAEHFMEPGDFVIAEGFHYPHQVDTVMNVARRRGHDPHENLERHLNEFPDGATAFVDATLFVLSDSPQSDIAKKLETKASATVVSSGDDVRIEGLWYKVKVHGEQVSNPVAFTRTWPKESDEDVEELKRDWRHDPHWDIEYTEAFEHHYSALKAYREGIAAERKAKEVAEREARIATLDAAAGLNGNRALAEYIVGLEDKVEWLDHRISDLLDREHT